jgi:hypothetical protein
MSRLFPIYSDKELSHTWGDLPCPEVEQFDSTESHSGMMTTTETVRFLKSNRQEYYVVPASAIDCRTSPVMDKTCIRHQLTWCVNPELT